jgi:hypothetical protein
MFSTRDDRDRPVRAYRLGVLESMLPQLVPRRERRAPADVLWKAYWRVLWSARLWIIAMALQLGAVLLAALTPLLLVGIGIETRIIAALGVYFVAFCLLLMVYARYVPLIAWPLWREALLGEQCCPGCGYRLAELPPDDDGCRVCPECGGAWRLHADD